MDVGQVQEELLALAQAKARGTDSEEIVRAFLATPRHTFVLRFSTTLAGGRRRSTSGFCRPAAYQ